MVPQQHCKMVTCQKCDYVPEVRTRQVPYTVCRMVTQAALPDVTCQQNYCVPEVKTRKICCTTCHMVTQQHCRMECYQVVLLACPRCGPARSAARLATWSASSTARW